ncbi:PIN domain-containing protein [Mycobacterium sp.]|uniref:PIN domain-containing protein n=1 Tax=Mycobacterium sp. TaxID=1785 RepID=UPI003F952B35
MEPLILDTGVLVAAVRGSSMVPEDADVAIPAIVVAEYLAGVKLDAVAGRRAAQKAFIDDLLTVVPIVNYDRSVAEHHAALLAHSRREGRRRGPHDLILAATARATGRTILTTDARARFDELPKVNARVVSQ